MGLRQIMFAVFAVVLGAFASANLATAKLVEVTINKVSQKMTVRVDGATEYVWLVSTGAASYETPSGQYKPFRMEKDHFSKEWDDAPMPNAIFFTERGHAVHGSFSIKSLGRRASHGCVRLHPDNAEILFNLVKEAGLGNTRFIVKGGFFDFGSSRVELGKDAVEKRKSTPWFLRTTTGVKSTKKPTATRSFASVSKDIDKTTKKPTDKKTAVKKSKPKKVALKCTTKDGKKTCKKPFSFFASSNS